jgi:hypothetical protein
MRYVLDSCAAVKWFLAEPDSAKAIQVLDEFNRQGDFVQRLPLTQRFPDLHNGSGTK